VTAGAALEGGNTAYVAEAVMHDGTPAVLKVAMPAGGDPYVRLLRYDGARRAFLLERLGKPLASLGWPVSRQLGMLVRTAARGWRPVTAAQFPAEAAKARWFGEYVASAWEDLGRPCPEAVGNRPSVMPQHGRPPSTRAGWCSSTATRIPSTCCRCRDMPGGSASSIPKELPPSPRWSWA
jgi:hypothetical protein